MDYQTWRLVAGLSIGIALIWAAYVFYRRSRTRAKGT